MKRISHTQSSSIQFMPAWLASVASVLLTGSVHAATNFMYDTYQQAPSTFPQNPPWTTVSTFVNGNDSQTASGRLLTLVKDISFNDPGYFYTHTLAPSEINSNTEYSVRTRARLASYGNNFAGEHALLQVAISDGTKFFGIGLTLGTGTNRFFVLGSGGPASSVYTAASPIGDDFFNILLTKTGTNGNSLDQISLYVDGVLAATQNYGNMPSDSGRVVYFGAASSAGSGMIQMTGASFGIGEFAPALIPEPSAVGLCLAASAIGIATLRRRQR